MPIDSEEALQSMELYLRTELAKIQRAYSDMAPTIWPSENDFLRLVEASSWLFIFSSMLIDYIGKEDLVSRLKHIVFRIGQSALDHRDPSHDVKKKNPFCALDLLYTTIMSDISVDSLPITKTILGFYLLGDVVARGHLNLVLVCNILGIERHEAYAALRKLSSVLIFPSSEEAQQWTY